MCIINASQEHFLAQIRKKSKNALKNFFGPGVRGDESRHMDPRTEGQEKQRAVFLLTLEIAKLIHHVNVKKNMFLTRSISGKVKHELRVTSSDVPVTSSNPRVRRLKVRVA